MAESQQQGLFARIKSYLFGTRTKRLSEAVNGAHILSYLLVIVQSVAVVLALGHQELQWLFSGSAFAQFAAAAALFLLVATVFAADLCVLQTLPRIPALFRNQQGWGLLEHMAYLAFVLSVEAVTLFIVLAVIEDNPQALISPGSLLPVAGALVFALLAARVLMTVWTMIQLNIVHGKLAPQWSTLILQGRELIGGKAQEAMANLNLEDASISDLFGAYGAMSTPPAPVARWWNRGIVNRRQAMLKEEARLREAVAAAVAPFDANTRLEYYTGPQLLDPGVVVTADDAPPAPRSSKRTVHGSSSSSSSAGKKRSPKPRLRPSGASPVDDLDPIASRVVKRGMSLKGVDKALSQAAGRQVSNASIMKYHARYADTGKGTKDAEAPAQAVNE